MPPFTDEEWDEISQELPHKEEPFIQKFLDGRQALIDQECKDRSDYHFRQSMTPIAKRACTIVAKIQDEERRTMRPLFPLFDTDKETRTWQIIRQLPKGAILHARLESMINPDFLFEEVLIKEPGMHIWCKESHLEPDETKAQPEFSIGFRANKTEQTSSSLIWCEKYVPDTPVSLHDAYHNYPGGTRNFRDWFRSSCAFSRHRSGAQQLGATELLKRHYESQRFMGKLILYEPILRKVLRHLMARISADGIRWAELRFAFPLTYCRARSLSPEPDHEHLLNVIDEEISSFKASPEGKAFWGLRFIWTSLRDWDSRTLVEDMDNCLAAKLSHPHLIAGYDVVGLGHTLSELLPELFWFRKQCAGEGVALPFLLTCTEQADLDAADALLLGARRLGPTPGLPRHPALVAATRDKRVLVEAAGPGDEGDGGNALPVLVARGVACALAPAGDWNGEDGQSAAFWAALRSWEELGLAGLGSLAENSVRWALFEDQSNEAWAADVRAASLGGGVKAERLQEWGVAWERFCLWIVDEFGQGGGEDEEEQREERGVQ